MAFPHPDDDLLEPEALVSPVTHTEPPLFAEQLPLVDEADDETTELEPAWIQGFDPWVLESIREYEHMEAQ